ncbi:hypothetical protein NE237_010871 [Protea cynaroides]|uniref:(+)-neomenthol dehydrogenase n=1 Tax=Protea cynaroides TaxID=273540 RepID=A0A9Q0L1F7_9MAGN|nr:hypothetical protein NE237_010871 [Protea cynaroides]
MGETPEPKSFAISYTKDEAYLQKFHRDSATVAATVLALLNPSSTLSTSFPATTYKTTCNGYKDRLLVSPRLSHYGRHCACLTQSLFDTSDIVSGDHLQDHPTTAIRIGCCFLFQFLVSQQVSVVNNAGIYGAKLNYNEYEARVAVDDSLEAKIANFFELSLQTHETAEECIQTNYYGTKRVTEALLPILQLSHSPRIVNVSSTLGRLQYVPIEWAKEVLGDVDALTKERVDGVLKDYLNDFKETQGSPAYTMSKAAINAYTRILAKKIPALRINCVCPGYVKTDINFNTGIFTVEEGAVGPVKLALLPDDGPSGLFFFQKEVCTFD